MKKYDVVIIGGGGLAGRTIVHTLYEAETDLSVLVIKNEKINVNRCTIPYGIDYNESRQKFTIPNEEITDYEADLIFGHANKIDPDKKEIHVSSNKENSIIGYEKLIITTGAKPILPNIEGINAKNITTAYGLEDLEHLRQLTSSSRKAVVLGGGFVGIEIVTELKQLGIEVSLVEKDAHILPATLEPEFIIDVENALDDNDIKLFKNCTISSFKHRNNRAIAAELDNGKHIEADFFVIAAGVTPDIKIATDAGIKASEYGIIVDNFMQTNIDNIYSAGDCIEVKSAITGQPIKSKFGTNAIFAARTIAGNLLCKKTSLSGIIDMHSSTVFNLSYGTAGLTEKTARDIGFDVMVGFSRIADRYNIISDTANIKTKLIFDKKTHRLLGGCILRKDLSVAANIDFISLACQMKMTLEDLMNYQYTSHPKLTAMPSQNIYQTACKDALEKQNEN